MYLFLQMKSKSKQITVDGMTTQYTESKQLTPVCVGLKNCGFEKTLGLKIKEASVKLWFTERQQDILQLY